jgi:hypothetical protein
MTLWNVAFNDTLSDQDLSTFTVGQAAPFPQPVPTAQPGFFGRPPSYYFEEETHQGVFNANRSSLQAWNASHRPGPAWTEADENQLVNKLCMTWFGEPYNWSDWTTEYQPLNLDKLDPIVKRKRPLPSFKIDYQTYAEIKLRLLNTIILINGVPFYVGKIKQKGEDYVLGVTGDGQSGYFTVKYSDIKDLRSLPPMYITTSKTGWLARHPGRVYQQGATRQNTMMFSIDGRDSWGIDSSNMLRAISRRENRKWNETLLSLMKSGDLTNTRLSDEVAVLRSSDKILACYKARPLGFIQDNTVTLIDEDDILQGWIEASAEEVGLELRVGNV